jgi:hypothetical protein
MVSSCRGLVTNIGDYIREKKLLPPWPSNFGPLLKHLYDWDEGGSEFVWVTVEWRVSQKPGVNFSKCY